MHMAPSLRRSAPPAVRYLVEPHSELDGCYQIARHSHHHPTQRIGNYTDPRTAAQVARFLNIQVDREVP